MNDKINGAPADAPDVDAIRRALDRVQQTITRRAINKDAARLLDPARAALRQRANAAERARRAASRIDPRAIAAARAGIALKEDQLTALKALPPEAKDFETLDRIARLERSIGKALRHLARREADARLGIS